MLVELIIRGFKRVKKGLWQRTVRGGSAFGQKDMNSPYSHDIIWNDMSLSPQRYSGISWEQWQSYGGSSLMPERSPPSPISASLLPLFISFLPAPPPFPVITSHPIPVCHTHTRTQMTAVELGGSGHPSTSQDYGLICRGLEFAKHCHDVTYIISYNLNLGLVISSQQWRKNTVI